MKKVWLILFMLLSPALLFAQDWNSKVGVGLTIDKGNSDRNLIVFDFNSRRKVGIEDIKTAASFSNETGQGRETIRKADFSSKINLFYHQDLFFFGALDMSHNTGAGIDYRIAPGVGAGAVLFQKTVLDTTVYSVTLNVGANPIIENLAGHSARTRGYYLIIQEFEYNFDARTHLSQHLNYKPNFRHSDDFLVDSSVAMSHDREQPVQYHKQP